MKHGPICKITSKYKSDPYAQYVGLSDFISGGLPVESFIRPNKIFTADKNIICSVAGHLCETKILDIINSVITIVTA